MYHTLATLVYRSIPSASSNTSAGFSPECIEAARNALRAHQENTTKYMDKNDYIWYGYMSWLVITSHARELHYIIGTSVVNLISLGF